jgi:hypothetical protein
MGEDEGRVENMGKVFRNKKKRLYLYQLLPTKQHNIPEDMDLQQHCYNNLVSHEVHLCHIYLNTR